MLNRESFFALPRPSAVPVAVGDGTVYVREMTAGERDAFEADQVKLGTKDFRVRLVVATASDADGKPLFTKADIPALSEMPASIVDAVAREAVRVNKLGEDEVGAEAKNS